MGLLDAPPRPTSILPALLPSVLRRGQADAVLTLLGDSTGNETFEWFYLLCQWLCTQYPAYTVTYRLWNDTTQAYDAASTLQTGTGARTLTVYNGSQPGAGFDYALDATRFPKLVPVTPTTVITSFGYNSTSASYRVQALELARWIGNTYPGVEHVMVSQPRKASTDTDSANSASRSADVRAIAVTEGLGLIDAAQAFYSYPGPETDLIGGDGIHPNATGQQLWAEQARRYFRADAPTVVQRSVPARVDRVFVDPSSFVVATGTPNLGVTANINIPVWFFDPDTEERLVCSCDIPPSWKSVNVYLLWSTAGGSTNGIVWQVDYQQVTASMNAKVSGYTWSSFTTGNPQTVASVNTPNVARVTQAFTAERFAGGRPVAFRVRRLATNASDTLAADAQFAGLLIERAE